MIGVGRHEGVVEYEMLEHSVRNVLNRTVERRMAVLRPLKVVLTNYPPGQVEEFEAVNNPEDSSAAGRARCAFSGELFIEREDFMEDPPKKFFRLSPGREVRLRSAYFITCQEVVKDAAGEVVELRCTYDPQSRGGSAPDGRSPKATLHWVSASHSVPGEVRLYDHLFAAPIPEPRRSASGPEPALGRGAHGLPPRARPGRTARASPGCSSNGSAISAWTRTRPPERPVFNRTVTLRDTWARVKAEPKKGAHP